MSWVIVTTRAASEEVAEARLRQHGYRCYLPRHRNRTGALVPLWPRYFFVADWRGWPQWTVPGEPRLLKVGGYAACMWDRDIQIIRDREQAGAFDDPMPVTRGGKRTDIGPGDAVELDLLGERLNAVLERLTDSGKAVVRVLMFERQTTLTVSQDALRATAS